MESIGTLTVVVLALAAYRITRLIVADTFPFEKWRLQTHGTWLGDLITCPFCTSVWVGGFLAVGQGLAGDTLPWQIFIGAMALSGVVSLQATFLPQSLD